MASSVVVRFGMNGNAPELDRWESLTTAIEVTPPRVSSDIF